MGSNDNKPQAPGIFPQTGSMGEKTKPPQKLTARQATACSYMMIAGDEPYETVARWMGIKPSTVVSHLKSAKQRTGFKTTQAMLLWLLRNGIVTPARNPDRMNLSPAGATFDPVVMDRLGGGLQSGPRLVKD